MYVKSGNKYSSDHSIDYIGPNIVVKNGKHIGFCLVYTVGSYLLWTPARNKIDFNVSNGYELNALVSCLEFLLQ